ncbi:DUF397 domain-containing protein [Micromonospora sp. SH-82]|uniref:DUF397 domain-containing protein n=1 Tax=Micromonospora sp. SH-82 TaxID=3132938 RepID=UPI003EBA8F6C
MTEHGKVSWKKSTRSDAEGNCIEVGAAQGNAVLGVRDTKDSCGKVLWFSPAAWTIFIRACRSSGFHSTPPDFP